MRRFHLPTTLSTILIATAMSTIARGDEIVFSKSDSETTRLTVDLLRSRHLENQPIDDALSAQLVNRFVDAWDHSRLYFSAADIQQFNASKNVLDDQLASGDISFAKQVFDRFQLRQQELAPVIAQLIDAEHDFSVDESLSLDFDARPWAATDEESRERWRKHIKSELLSARLDGQTIVDARKKIHRRYRNLLQLSRQTETHELLEIYLTCFTRCLDPHSTYMAPSSQKEFNIAMNLRLQGIGAKLRATDGNTVVEEVVPGGSAAADGRLAKGDTIVAVGKADTGPMTDVVGLKLSRVVDQIRGPAGSVVRLKVTTVAGESAVYTLTRQVVKLEEQEARGVIIEANQWAGDGDERIGVLTLPSFYRDFQRAAKGGKFKSTSRDVKKILGTFREQNVDAVVIDLRGNGGGALEEAVEVSGLFIPTGPVVQVQSRGESVSALTDDDPSMSWAGPLVVVCDRLSASASEIFAAAMKDYGRALIVGDRTTHGKGTVQNVVSLANGIGLFRKDRGALKLTVGKWYRVTGDGSQIAGVASDILLPSLTNAVELGESGLDNAILFDRVPKQRILPFTAYRTETIVAQLQQRSGERVADDEQFQRLKRRIAFVSEQRRKKSIPLNESAATERRTLLKTLAKNDSEEVTEAKSENGHSIPFRQTFYNREILSITVDYLRLLNKEA